MVRLGRSALPVVAFAALALSSPASAPVPPSYGTVSVLRLPSVDDEGQRDVWVYRPAGRTARTAPVLYFLHGLPGGPSDVFDAGLREVMDALPARGGLPFIVAAPDGNGRTHVDTEWADSTDGADRLETFVTTTLRAAVEGDHPRDRAHRAIAGFSMGGYGAANLAARHPDLYSQVVSIDGYFHVDDPSGVFGRQAEVERANSPDQQARSMRRIRTLLVHGRSDPDPLTAPESERFARLLAGAGAPYRVRNAPGGHSLAFLATQLSAMARFLDERWTRR